VLPSTIAVLNKLEKVKGAGADKFTALCSGHEDHNRSLSIGEKDGKTVLHCFVGCPVEQIVAGVGLTMADLFNDAPRATPLPSREPPPSGGRIVSRFDLSDGSVAEHWRLDTPDGKRMWWTRNGKMGLDGYPVKDIPLMGAEAIKGATLVVEGETPLLAVKGPAWRLGYSVVATVCGASTVPSEHNLGVLLGHYVALWPDNDAPGRDHMRKIAKWLTRHGETPFFVASIGLPPKGDAADAVRLGMDIGALLGDAYPFVDTPDSGQDSGFNTYF